MPLRTHEVTLRDGEVVLRPLTEGDWDVLYRWNNDPEVLYFSEGDDIRSRTMEETKGLYAQVSESAFMFMIEHGGIPVGECWLQRMNLQRLLDLYRGKLLFRIDLSIGEKGLWGRGIGTRAVRLLTRFGFEERGADMIFGLSIGDYNPRSLRTFRRAGYTLHGMYAQAPGAKGRFESDVVMTREGWEARKA
ncbi:MAG: GNAT family N-acetyltransferase [Candidatus Coatesbacteria bacterium]